MSEFSAWWRANGARPGVSPRRRKTGNEPDNQPGNFTEAILLIAL
jgi:hypothetical protein